MESFSSSQMTLTCIKLIKNYPAELWFVPCLTTASLYTGGHLFPKQNPSKLSGAFIAASINILHKVHYTSICIFTHKSFTNIEILSLSVMRDIGLQDSTGPWGTTPKGCSRGNNTVTKIRLYTVFSSELWWLPRCQSYTINIHPFPADLTSSGSTCYPVSSFSL